MALAASLATFVPAASQAPVFDYYGTWGKQDSDKPDFVTTRGATWIYKYYPECKLINASGGSQLLIRAQCYSDPQEAEDVTLQYDILSETQPLRIQLRGQVSTEYLKCP